MEWHGNLRTFVPRPENPFNFLYDSSCCVQYNQGMDVKPPVMSETAQVIVPVMEKLRYGSHEKKKRLTNDQLESLERSFQEEIKLDHDRKMKLSRELGLQPRQIAVWFQNRRARWKAKQLERLYDTLKQEFDAVSVEKQKLQEEVMKLKGILREQATKKQVLSTGYTEISGEETVQSKWVGIRSSSGKPRGTHQQEIAECNYLLNLDEYNPGISSYWAVLPSYP